MLLRKDCGLVSQVLSESDLSELKGSVALGHVRYATAGTRTWMAAQPHLFSADDLTIALAHNGTLVNSDETRRDLISEGVEFRTDSDSEVAAAVIVRASRGKGSLFDGIRHMMRRLRGGYAMAVIDEDSLYAYRDPNGIRPLVLGALQGADGNGWIVSSETCALDMVGTSFVREIRPGEIVRISADGINSEPGIAASAEARCIFEHVYFSRSDSVDRGSSMYAMRVAMGRLIAQESPVDADVVIGVPESGLPPAEGYAAQLGIRYGEGFTKNRYVARTFIEPTQGMRELGVMMKLTALADSVRGRRVVMVDDSIVRGTTMRQLVHMLRKAGAVEVHVRIMCPEVRWPCFYGIDTDTQDQLISAYNDPSGICSFIGADSLAFLSLEGLLSCVPPGGYCTACFTGTYPVRFSPETYAGCFLEDNVPSFSQV